jgi:Thrombospondin type 3 repeat
MVYVEKLSKRARALTPALMAAMGAALACAFAAPHTAAQYAPIAAAAPTAPAALSPGEEDTDGDGIPDNEDACKRIKGVASDTPRLNGCPPPPPPVDTDGDGIGDPDDACPKKKGVASSDPKLNGCPPAPPPRDTDGDGIPDRDDACPRKKGVASDDPKLNGCAAVVAKALAAAPTRIASAAAGPAQLTFAGFRSFDDGTSLVFVELTGPVAVDVKKVRGTLVYTLANTRVPLRNNRNPLLTSDFSSIVRRTTIAQRKKAVEISLQLKADIQPEQRLVQRGAVTVLEIQLPKAPPASARSGSTDSESNAPNEAKAPRQPSAHRHRQKGPGHREH